MDKLMLYLLQSQLSLILLFSIYMLVLRKQTYFQYNRLFLLFSVIASVLIPLFDFSFVNPTDLYYVQLPEIAIASNHQAEQVSIFFDPSNILLIIYSIISIILTLIMIWNLISIFRLKKDSIKMFSEHLGIHYQINSSQNFSFFNWIFIKETDRDNNAILEHEKAHVNLFHSLDILVIKIFQIVFWMNPLGFLIEREIRLQHEYEADRWVLKKHHNITDYQQMLLNQVFLTEFNLIPNNFNQSFLKNRFTMMTKKENKKRNPLLLVFITLTLLVPLIFSCTMESKDKTDIIKQTEETSEPKPNENNIEKQSPIIDETIKDSTFTLVEKMPSFPGGEKELFRFIGENIEYPEIAKKAGVEGRCFISFIIDKDGSIQNTEVFRSVSYGLEGNDKINAAKLCDQEALRVINNMPKWEPGENKGEKVKVEYRIPIKFTLK